MDLDSLFSVINGFTGTDDENRAFTFIEFIKSFGGDNTEDVFIHEYKEYLIKWAKAKQDIIDTSEKEYVREKMIDILKTITLTYSSYEEQQFIATIDWHDKEQIKTVLPLYVRKIREICEFYRKKRNEAKLIIKKNSMKGSYRSVVQIIYDKIIDFIFNNRALQPQMAELKKNLMVSIEQYVDTYAEYFDITESEVFNHRYFFNQAGNDFTQGGNSWTNGGNDFTQGGNSWTNGGNDFTQGGNSWTNGGNDFTQGGNSWTNGGNEYNFTEQPAEFVLEANSNPVDARVFTEMNRFINDSLYEGDVFLDELGLMAPLALDFTQACTGEMEVLKNELISEATANQLSLQEQVDVKKRFFKKFLGTDLYYMYVDKDENIEMDLLCEAENPSGNLLNCDSSDRAATPRDHLTTNSNNTLYSESGESSGSGSSGGNGSSSGGTSDGSSGSNGGNNSGNGGSSGSNGGSNSGSNSGSGNSSGGSSSWGSGSSWGESGSNSWGGNGSSWQNEQSGESSYGITSSELRTLESQIKLLTHIGLFFKPDKTSILKIDARDFTWTVNKEAIKPRTMYVFPDPTKYGNYGNNKNGDYPLIMEFKMDNDIRNISSGSSSDDPLILLDRQAWQTYYSKQQDIFKLIDNKNFEYSFSSLANIGFIQNYQIDNYGNEFGLFKGFKVVYSGEPGDDDYHIDHVEVPEGWFPEREEEKEPPLPPDAQKEAYIINGGYFENPYYQGFYLPTSDGTLTYIAGRKFDYEKKLTINEFYHWTGLKLGIAPIVTPEPLYPHLDFGDFVEMRKLMQIFKYYDHFRYTERYIDAPDDKQDIVEEENPNFQTEDDDFDDIPVIEVDRSYTDMADEPGNLYVKNGYSIESKPLKFEDAFYWLPKDIREKKIITYYVRKGVIIFETEDEIVFSPYKWSEDNEIVDNLDLSKLIFLPKGEIIYSDVLWCEEDQVFYLVAFNPYESSNHLKTLVPVIYKFNPVDYTFGKVVSGWEFSEEFKKELDLIDKQYFFAIDRFDAYQAKIKDFIAKKKDVCDTTFFTSLNNLENFNFPYQETPDFGHIIFTYNNNLGLFLIAYIFTDNHGEPHIYEHKFRIGSNELFNDTLVTNLYTLGGSDKSTNVYNEQLDSGFSNAHDKSYFFSLVG